ncbi:MAG: phosphomannomutase/phosphoglucomutase [Alphaproteobacteria bacterium GM7ARS4]|nr:phosphomannomutase/phosphoglucomutase [Alphaproteobacteria bacterium GM7ARS4]
MATSPSHVLHPSLVRAYDIRGIVGETLHAKDAYAIGMGFGSLLAQRAEGRTGDNRAVCVGYDGRLSSVALKTALCEGLKASGVLVWDIGLVPTPMLYFSVYHLKASGGLMVTGSHNPPDHNGFKCMLGTSSFYGDDLKALARRIAQGDVVYGCGKIEKRDVLEAYVARLRLALEGTRLGVMSVVWDPGSGAAGVVLPSLLDGLAGRHHIICGEVDGRFPHHHPDPSVEDNLTHVKQAICEGGYDIGFAFDGDGDRLGVVDNEGQTLHMDMLLACLVRDVLASHKGGVIVSDVKAGYCLRQDVEACGGTLRLIPTGHSIIKAAMARMNAPFGGEMSGHIFFKDCHEGYDDGLYASLRFLSWLTRQDKTLHALRNSFPKSYHSGEMRLACQEGVQFSLLERIKKHLEEDGVAYGAVDGVRVDDEDGWWLVRASNTQAVVVAVCEALTEDAFAEKVSMLSHYLSPHGIEMGEVTPRK